MKIDEAKFKEFCSRNRVNKEYESVLRKLCLEVAGGSIVFTTLEEDYKAISKINNTREKVKYLRAKGYTQEKVAEIIDISLRQVQKIEAALKKINI